MQPEARNKVVLDRDVPERYGNARSKGNTEKLVYHVRKLFVLLDESAVAFLLRLLLLLRPGMHRLTLLKQAYSMRVLVRIVLHVHITLRLQSRL